MTLTNEEQAALELAERHVAIERSLRPDESLPLARALISIHVKLEAAEREQKKCFTDGQKAVDSARKERDRLRAELTEARNKLEIATKAIEDAPHYEHCASKELPHQCGFGIHEICGYAIAGCDTHRPGWRECRCWKAYATAALSRTPSQVVADTREREWRIQAVFPYNSVLFVSPNTEEKCSRLASEYPNLFRKQWRYAAGPWQDCETNTKGGDDN